MASSGREEPNLLCPGLVVVLLATFSTQFFQSSPLEPSLPGMKESRIYVKGHLRPSRNSRFLELS
jgi:hypothetical protein